MQHPFIAREGWVFLFITFGLALVVTLSGAWVWSVLLWIVFAFVLQFFRDPAYPIPDEADAVVAPAHGKVVAIGDVDDPYLKRPSKRISIFMNVFSIHSNRLPVGGVVKGRWYYPGRFFNAALDKSSSQNERNAVWVQTQSGVDVVSVQIAGLIARRILCYVEKGDPVRGGERYGFIRFGSRVDVYLPESSEISVQLGQWVTPGSDIIARITLPENATDE